MQVKESSVWQHTHRHKYQGSHSASIHDDARMPHSHDCRYDKSLVTHLGHNDLHAQPLSMCSLCRAAEQECSPLSEAVFTLPIWKSSTKGAPSQSSSRRLAAGQCLREPPPSPGRPLLPAAQACAGWCPGLKTQQLCCLQCAPNLWYCTYSRCTGTQQTANAAAHSRHGYARAHHCISAAGQLPRRTVPTKQQCPQCCKAPAPNAVLCHG